MRDARKVQTAVLGSAGSRIPVLMPFDRAEALRLRHDHRASPFSCGSWLGGCGRELSARIGIERVPHFAHHPDHRGRPTACGRTEHDERSADHLYISRALPGWLRGQRLRGGAVALEGSVPGEGGVCTGMLAPIRGHSLIAVALREDPAHGGFDGRPARDAALRSAHPHVSWLFGETTPLARHLLDRQGWALRIRCDPADSARPVQIGTQIGGSRILWADLAACTCSPTGLRTPYLDEARTRPVPRSASPARSAAAPEPAPPPTPAECLPPAEAAAGTARAKALETMTWILFALTVTEPAPDAAVWALRDCAEALFSHLSLRDRAWAQSALAAHDTWLRDLPRPDAAAHREILSLVEGAAEIDEHDVRGLQVRLARVRRLVSGVPQWQADDLEPLVRALVAAVDRAEHDRRGRDAARLPPRAPAPRDPAADKRRRFFGLLDEAPAAPHGRSAEELVRTAALLMGAFSSATPGERARARKRIKAARLALTDRPEPA